MSKQDISWMAYIKNPNKTKDTAILVRFSRTRQNMPNFKIYLDKGFNILVYDSRNNEEWRKDTTLDILKIWFGWMGGLYI